MESKKADMEVKLNDGSTALALGCMMEKLELTKLLLEQKADAEAPVEGLTLLLRAAHAGQTEVIKQLAETGANINYATPEGMTALNTATKLKNKDAMVALIDLKADMELKDEDGLTALWLAVLHDLVEPCETLIEKGADKETTYKAGDTLVHIAASQGFEDMTDLLIKSKCSVNGVNESGITPILMVISTMSKREYAANERIVKALCEAKADMEAKFGNKTAVGMLRAMKDKDGAKELMEVVKPFSPKDFTMAAKAKYAAQEMAEKAEAAARGKKESAKKVEYKVGQEVEVWSKSANSWCSGTVDAIDGDAATVSYTNPEGKQATKKIPLNLATGQAEIRAK